MQLTRWNKETKPSLEALRQALGKEGYRVSEWTDAPGTVYPVHMHEHSESRWIVRGALRVGIIESGEEITLHAGDRLDLAPNEMYWADVEGDQPVMYLIGIKNGKGDGRRVTLRSSGLHRESSTLTRSDDARSAEGRAPDAQLLTND